MYPSRISITFHGMAPEASIEGAIWRWIDRLELATTRFQHCAVVVAHGPRAFEVDVEAEIAGVLAVATHDPARTDAHADAYVAVSDAFRTIWRQLRGHYTRTSHDKAG